MTNEEKWREHSVVLNQVGWKLAVALGHAKEGDGQVEDVDVLELVDEVIGRMHE